MIEHLKSGLSISTHIGCTMSCSYCVLSGLPGFEDGPKQDSSAADIISSLMSGRELFINGETPLIINNRTDPLLPTVVDSSLELLDLLLKANVTSPVVLISKFPPTAQLSKFFELMPLIFIYSYSGISTDFNHTLLKEHLLQFEQYSSPASRLHYYRPIIPGLNDDIQGILDCLDLFRRAQFSGSIITGLRVNANNKTLIDEHTSFDPNHKIMQHGLFSEILNTLADARIDYPVYRHTSCAIASFLKRKCKLGYFQREDHCSPTCKNRIFCSDASNNNQQILLKEIEYRYGLRIKYEPNENKIIVNGQINQEEVAFLRNAVGLAVEADNVILSPSERNILAYV